MWKRGINASTKSFDPGQPAQSAQADTIFTLVYLPEKKIFYHITALVSHVIDL